ncbi:MAG: phospholipase A [Campylobacterota bacterium]|nr:phospholipase A [Campylobacterota bacterium]
MRLFLVLLFLTTTLFSSTEFEDAYKIYKNDDFTTSFELFKKLATDDNDLDAAYILAYMYEHGEGCAVNEELAAKWYKISSRGYYYQTKYDSTRDIDKEQRKLYRTIERSEDSQTQGTIRQYTQSLYNIKAHKANYFLPLSYRYDGVYADTNGHEAQKLETEFQVSIKFDFASSLLGLNEIYSVAYTQLAFWQLYSDSAYFRETNYNPELYITIPASAIDDVKFIKAIRVALEHESNGRGGLEERSWNFLSSSFYFQYKTIFSELKLWTRLPDNIDYNPDLIDYMGHGHIKFMLPYEKHFFEFKLRHSFRDYGAVEANYSHPVIGRDDLFLYIKTFNGYAESLVDYNNYINKVGIGLSISR